MSHSATAAGSAAGTAAGLERRAGEAARVAPQRHVAGAGAAAPRTGVEVIDGAGAFLALEHDWDALAERLDAAIFHRHVFIRLWLAHFAPTSRVCVLALRDGDGTLRAVLPLLRRHTRLYGIPVRELSAAANLHSCRFDLLAEDPAAAADAFLAALEARKDWDVLRLPDVPEGGSAEALVGHAGAHGLAAGSWPSIASPYVPLPNTPAALDEGLRSHFLANLRRRRRRLGERGEVTVERIDGGPHLRPVLQQGLALEASGWKGREGTAILQDGATVGFYRALAEEAAARGALALWLLRVDGRAIAFHYALEDRGRYLLLKPAYDEALRECSPGQLLTQDVLHDAIGRGLHEFDFLGPSMPWKRDWTPHARQHNWLYLFRGARGRLLHAMKFRLLPALRRLRRVEASD